MHGKHEVGCVLSDCFKGRDIMSHSVDFVYAWETSLEFNDIAGGKITRMMDLGPRLTTLPNTRSRSSSKLLLTTLRPT